MPFPKISCLDVNCNMRIALIYLNPSIYGGGHYKRLMSLKRILAPHGFDFSEHHISSLIDLTRVIQNLWECNLVLDLCSSEFLSQVATCFSKYDASKFLKILCFEGIGTSCLTSDLFNGDAVSIFPYFLERDSPIFELNQNSLIGPQYHVPSSASLPLGVPCQTNPPPTVDSSKYQILLSAGFTDPSHITERVLNAISMDQRLSSDISVWYTSTSQPSYSFSRSNYTYAVDIDQRLFDYLP